MAKQIKVLKCPQCGNTKPLAIGKEHYRCSKCGSEFFLDNDDINVNVNYNYGQTTKATGSSDEMSILKNIGIFTIIAFVILTILAISIVTYQAKKSKKNHQSTTQTTKYNYKDDKYPILLSNGSKAIVFYIEKRNNSFSSNEAKKGYFAVFRDMVTNDMIKEEKLSLSKNIDDHIEYRHFFSNHTDYLILNNEYVYKIDSDKCILENIADKIATSKPALNTGFSSISFVPENEGEGFRLITNLGKEFYYFPNPDMLCTPRAFKHIAEGGFSTASPKAKDIVYYLFYNKDSKESSNVAELLQIAYKFNIGGPECKMSHIKDRYAIQPEKYRILSITPIIKERICFSPEVLYFDDKNILISYQATLAKNTPTKIELLDTSGQILWTSSFDKPINPKRTVKTNQGFVIQTIYDQFYEIKSNGKENILHTLD